MRTQAACPQRPVVRQAPINTRIDGNRVLTGRIQDAATSTLVGGGSVMIRGTPRGVRVDSSGRFQLALTQPDTGRLVLLIRNLGFETQSDTVVVARSSGINTTVFLTYSNVCLEPVVPFTRASQGSLDSLRRVP